MILLMLLTSCTLLKRALKPKFPLPASDVFVRYARVDNWCIKMVMFFKNGELYYKKGTKAKKVNMTFCEKGLKFIYSKESQLAIETYISIISDQYERF